MASRRINLRLFWSYRPLDKTAKAFSIVRPLVDRNGKRRRCQFDMCVVRRYFPNFDDVFPDNLALLGHASPNFA
jgi:hypothetical protein